MLFSRDRLGKMSPFLLKARRNDIEILAPPVISACCKQKHTCMSLAGTLRQKRNDARFVSQEGFSPETTELDCSY